MAISPSAIALTPQEALSGILGSISISCWIFLLIPQLVENIRNSSAQALSLPFLLIWFVGDICNLGGAAWAGLVPTVIAIAVYFCLADGVLIAQCGYYNFMNRQKREGRLGESGKSAGDGRVVAAGGGGVEDADTGEEEPLLARQRSGSITIPGSGRRRMRRSSTTSSSSSAGRRRRSTETSNVLERILEENNNAKGASKLWVKNLLSIFGIVAVGTAGWAFAWGSGVWLPTPVGSGNTAGGEKEDSGPLGAQILGYMSAAAYLGARIPQIVKNAREKSCEGLSLLFFILSLMGNLTYGAGILFHSLEREYIITNVPWLIGSLGTMVEDVVIFVQFHIYAKSGQEEEQERPGEVAVV